MIGESSHNGPGAIPSLTPYSDWIQEAVLVGEKSCDSEGNAQLYCGTSGPVFICLCSCFLFMFIYVQITYSTRPFTQMVPRDISGSKRRIEEVNNEKEFTSFHHTG
jgi:hypothetical protein